jgi:hypothetical protein
MSPNVTAAATKDPRMDAYIANAAPFARPILKHLRKVVHAGCPGVLETMKWSMPHFEHKGIMCGMAAFQQHCTFSFWKGALIFGEGEIAEERAMGQFGRITKIGDLPKEAVLIGYVRKAVELNDSAVPTPTRRKPAEKRPELAMPDDFAAALKKNAAAEKTFVSFPPGKQREYVEWITEAKRPATRATRLATSMEWLAEGKPRMWKYLEKTK